MIGSKKIILNFCSSEQFLNMKKKITLQSKEILTMTEERKQKIKDELEFKLNEALVNLRSSDIKLRKKSVRHLSDRSRLGIGDYKSLVTSNWFLDRRNRDELFEIIRKEEDETVISELLHALYWVCFLRADWEQKYNYLPEAGIYKQEVRSFVERFVGSRSSAISGGVAGLLAFFQDSRAWDIFYIVLQKKRDYLTLARFRYAYDHNEGNKFISESQVENLKEALILIDSKSNKQEVKSVIIDMLNKL